MNESAISLNLRRIRRGKGLSQKRVAEAAGISLIAYRNIESGTSMPRVSTLQAVARALGVQLQDLVAAIEPVKSIRFRAQKRMASREQIVADVTRWLRDFNYLEELLNDRKQYRLQELAATLSSDALPGRAIRAAVGARQSMGLTDREPIRDTCGLLEANGIKVFPRTFASQGFFGLSVAAGDQGPAVIVNTWDRISVERWIFTAAHELGHLLLHLDAYDVDRIDEDEGEEAEANTFASYFLMPQSVFQSEWTDSCGLPFVERVLRIKRMFRVSYKTVLYRLSTTTGLGNSVWQRFHVEHRRLRGGTLTLSDEPQALSRDSFQASSPEIFRRREPANLCEEDFVEDRLSGLVRRAVEGEEISLSRGGEILRLDLQEMRDVAASWVE